MLFAVILLVYTNIMCVHPVENQNLIHTTDKYETIGLEEYDNCDYVYKLNDVNTDNFVVLQLNIRGITSKKSQLIDLLDNTTVGKTVDVVVLSETWLTPFSPDFSIPGYDFFQQCRLDKKRRWCRNPSLPENKM